MSPYIGTDRTIPKSSFHHDRMKHLLLLLLLLIHQATLGQDNVLDRSYTDRSWDLLVGGSLGGTLNAELGLARRYQRAHRKRPFATVLYVSVERNFGYSMGFAPKVGAWRGSGPAGLCFGVSGLYYSQPILEGFCVRPEIGFGYERFKVTYAYNVYTNQARISPHMLTVALLFSFKVTELPAE